MHQGLPVQSRQSGDWSTGPEDVPAAFQAVTRELSMTQRIGDERLALMRRAYQACVGDVDYQLGRMFGHLTQSKLLENTWIIFTSDHGEMLGDHYLGGKCVPFEASAGVPFIVRPPHSARDSQQPWRGSTRDDLITLADIAPSICGITGSDSTGMTGLDFSQSFTNPEAEAPKRDLVFYSCMYLHGVRNDRYKVVRETLNGTTLAFDLVNDPHETENIWQSGGAIIRELSQELDAHLERLEARHGTATAADGGVLKSTDHIPHNTHPGFRRGS